MKNLFGQFKIYPRGFLGAQLAPILVQKPGSAPNSTHLQYDTTIFDANDTELVTANQDIQEAYTQLLRRDVLEGDFMFRERTLRTILKAFGTNDFEEWYLVQYQSPSFGAMQRDFLEDCFHFMWKGTRMLPLTTWSELLNGDTSPIADRKLAPGAANAFHKTMVHELHRGGRHSLVDTVQTWVSKPNGFMDLLLSAHILFGFKQ